MCHLTILENIDLRVNTALPKDLGSPILWGNGWEYDGGTLAKSTVAIKKATRAANLDGVI